MRAALFFALLGASSSLHANPPPPELIGEWWTPGFGARVRLEPCADAVCGRVVWVWDMAPDIVDKAPLVGRQVVDGMRLQPSGRWSGGRLYNPEDGRHYQGSLQLRSAENLLVEGCVLVLCRKQVWRRADAGACPGPPQRTGNRSTAPRETE